MISRKAKARTGGSTNFGLWRLAGADHAAASGFMANPLNGLAAILLAAIGLYHTVAGTREVIEDYVPGEGAAAAFKSQKHFSPYAGRNFPTQVYWGDTHLHTGMSFDAGSFGARLMPADAYRFARGETVTSSTGVPARLHRPASR